MNETETRIVIDRLLRRAGWRLPGDDAPNVRAGQRIGGERNLEADYVLVSDTKSFSLAVLEAKRSEIGALSGKEQAREYAENLNVPYVILSNGNEHYFWDIAHDQPLAITAFPSLEDLKKRHYISSKADNFDSQKIDENYIIDTQGMNCPSHKRHRMRDYQIDAVQAVQNAAMAGERAFLLEMATGTGKTLVAAAAIKLFMTTGNAHRILFIVDRLDLEDQAQQDLNSYLSNSWKSFIYKKHPDDWNRAKVLVSTVQTLVAGNRYKDFSPMAFDLLIVDEAHRAIGGPNARTVFDYFNAYKLGLTATPKNYMNGVTKSSVLPKEKEARELRDTYRTFGCANGIPTFRYDLEQGAREDNLVMPRLIDIRTIVTTELLSEKGFCFFVSDDPENDNNKKEKGPYWKHNYERIFFSENTNYAICRTIIENALRDPLSGDVGKSIVYCVSQRHAEKITAILNQLAAEIFPGKYQSDFALQITSNVQGAQEYTRSFANNKLRGKTHTLERYDSSKTRICVTVGMMTAGYNCPDILNICILRPIFVPSEFIQIRGRGTRRHTFRYNKGRGEIETIDKTTFMLFDFFAVCEYFEKTTSYDETLSLSYGGKNNRGSDKNKKSTPPEKRPGAVIYPGEDEVVRKLELIFPKGMRIDNERYAANVEQQLLKDDELRRTVKENRLSDAESLCRTNYSSEIIDFLWVSAQQHSARVYRRVSIGEVLMLIFGEIQKLKSREKMMDEELDIFIDGLRFDDEEIATAAGKIFKACLGNKEIMKIVKKGTFANLAVKPDLDIETCEKVPRKTHLRIVRYIEKEIDSDIYTDIAA